MPYINSIDALSLIGPAPIVAVTDDEIFEHLLTPTVKGLLGPVVKVEGACLMETTAGRFAGDQVTNLNQNQLRDEAGQLVSNRLRFPYVHHLYRTANGAVVIKRDLLKVWVACWFGDVEKGKGELIFKAALRDRRHDGTLRANDCSLLDYSYADPEYHKPLSRELTSVELSIYGYMPGSRVFDATGDEEFDRFVGNPFKFMDDPDKFLHLFQRAFHSKRAPGQAMAAIPDVARYALPGFEHLARKYGYDLIEMAASHYHVARWAVSGGYHYSSRVQALAVENMAKGLEKIRQEGTPLTRSQQSWVVALQSLRPIAKIPQALRFITDETAHLVWPQDNVSDRCLWMYKTLSKKASGFVPNVFDRQA
ncbi:MAG TPA: hypothetical protein PLC15_18105 [Candidatus Obscuribacter sp.]|nr:hypothetical protein [Candidatus Obscuribacter sp.]HMW89858.1 hypothetical protein [Candidatus Obscuribacter sp.]HNB17303.1 hypothetical protein [Candidatus Obscuribacter sp.]